LKFRTTYCANKTNNRNNKMGVMSQFPNLKFKDDNVCDPCNLECIFSISSADEQMETEQILRAKNSNEVPVVRPHKLGSTTTTTTLKPTTLKPTTLKPTTLGNK
jgi:hypothetical protein